jgi:transcriptional regulator
MYLPAHFEESDPGTMARLIADHPLGALITVDDEGLHADHIPFLHETTEGEFGRLVGHVAKSNLAWHRPTDGPGAGESLVIFEGPSAYISPNWYETKRETHKVVPTYNYTVVHVYGPLIIHDDAKWVRGLVGKLTKRMESSQPQPWKMSDAPFDFMDQQIANIVGVEIRITRMIGKWKTSQNRVAADRLGAAAGLRASGQPDQLEMADLILERISE